MVEVKGKGNIVARIVADSVSSVNGKRITTYELEYHRYIHSEFMTHRMFSRNAASSRAIPVSKMLENVRTAPAIPIHWGANKAGMQAGDECENKVQLFGGQHWNPVSRERAWQVAMLEACQSSENFSDAGYHKQIVNRITEPYQMMKVVCTATEYENFFWLRNHEAAQPEIAELARCMWEAREQSEPNILEPGAWHTPYYEEGYWHPDYSSERYAGVGPHYGKDYVVDFYGNTLKEALMISSSCCAQVSYRKLDDSLDKAIDIYDKLLASDRKHASPFEHSACPMPEDVSFDTEGVTHLHKDLGYGSGNLFGWIQYRQLIKDQAVW